jgi:hypothetical protein
MEATELINKLKSEKMEDGLLKEFERVEKIILETSN